MNGVHLVLGATSGIGQAVARRLAERGCALILSARDEHELRRLADDVQVRYGVGVAVERLDMTDYSEHAPFAERCLNHSAGQLAGVVACQGFMANQSEAERDFELVKRMIDVNYAANVSILNRFALSFQQKRAGYICGISSVAGDRGRQSNFLYGSTKSAFSAYLQGLRNRLFRSQVAVIDVKPGFVDTAMTWGLINPESPLVASPDRVARDVVRAIVRRKNTVYTPWFWRGILFITRSIPEPIFKRLSL
jgi:short-subunit dehydrogenase